MANSLKPYIPFDWSNIAEPATPFLSLSFRGNPSFYYTFPSNNNRIYVESAALSVIDENGTSSASITLADPDFVNLEVVFLKAVFLANSMTIGEGNWFCSILWGWTSYGKAIDGTTKTSSRHTYMLKNLTYDLTDVELRVSFDLMDIGGASFGSQTQDSADVVVGKLNGAKIADQNGQIQADTVNVVDPIVSSFNTKPASQKDPNPVQFAAVGNSTTGAGKTDVEADVNPSQSPNAQQGQETPPSYDNIISGKTYWKIIQIVCQGQGITAIAANPAPGDPGVPKDAPVEEGGKYKIPITARFKDEIDKLKEKIAAVGPADKHWDILAGGFTTKDSYKQQMVWGWKPHPPKAGTNLADTYRLARIFTYRPGSKIEIASGETLISSLRYTWTSRGAMAVGVPPIFAIAPDASGKLTVYTSEDSVKNRKPSQDDFLQYQPGVKPYTLQDAKRIRGVEVDFNFDTRTTSKDKIELVANTLIINVWNFFLSEIVEVTIEIAGDPWLDNTLFSSDKPPADGDVRTDDRLVDMYNSYFKLKVYKPGESPSSASAELNPILTGNYLCLKGCVHNISAGEYNTTLTLIGNF